MRADPTPTAPSSVPSFVANSVPAGRGLERTFFLLWGGQTLSLLGTRLSGFILGIWVFEETGSVARFTLIAAIGLAGGLLISPFVGTLADRFDRRLAMALGDGIAGVRSLVLLLLWLAGNLEVWHVYVAVVVRSVAEAIQTPAAQAAVTMLVPRRHLGRASGLQQLGDSGSRVLAPALAGGMMTVFGLGVVLVVDLVSFAVALAVLVLIHIPRPKNAPRGRPRLLADAAFGWHYLRRRPPLLRLLVYFAVLNIFMGLGFILITPLVLAFTDAAQVGAIRSVAAVGGVLGAALMTAWGGPRRRMTGILGATILLGLGLAVAGARPSLFMIGGGVFLFALAMPVVTACSQAIWQSKVEPGVQGRVFAMRRLISQGTGPIAFFLAGILADRFFEPLLEPGGTLAGSVGRWLGVGEGRGMGLMILLMGAGLFALGLLAFFRSSLHGLEDEVPDAEGGVETDESGS